MKTAKNRVAFTTLGCRTNQNDTAEMQAILMQEGFSVVDSGEEADIYVVNTCTVTQKSDQNSRLAVKKSLAINDQALVVFTGCYAQLNPEEAAQLNGLDIVLGNANKLEIADAIKTRLEQDSPKDAEAVADIVMTDIHAPREFKALPISAIQGRTKAFIKVQTGCDEKCSFCTVVRARGKSISDTRENILNNVRHAIDSGFKEITLTGINLGTWGMDFTPAQTFSSLVKDIIDLPGDYRVRLSSINPMEIEDELIDLMAQSDRICPHLHIPLQSGDDTILTRMRRNYLTQPFIDVVEKAASAIPELALGADLIVGFPGETDEQFENTRRLVERLPFTYLHVFTYSPREGTEAYDFKNEVPKKVKKERNRILTAIAKQKSLDYQKRFLNRKATVLVEAQRTRKESLLKGHTEHYIAVEFSGDDALANQLTEVRITDVSEQQVAACLPS
ncbi:MAG: tRNA (N(6)-L-threonylcarbamoyladenosine(37)-C(2))-methylthiotransferase MtaB [Candidatus Nitrohelix vancouverensis]|uniref:Threonylcarbamoyladenosine tRNA methylthiotransferase MtaB n=1 Tax=Candidatus Nitrohelix vancouverensis TaxID=2705534 RepID=A0A7T0C4K7_9BACT|nr:MAG: tRNA (N(6)-L-threonylcarbamoyladenosine(37)-C(2))-methylthiotransferase MtaB [Candidatus Nitrohelix vancouverensis]